MVDRQRRGVRRRSKNLVYAGKVDHGFDKTSSAALREKLTPLIRKTHPTPRRSSIRASRSSRNCWRKIEYRAKSAEGKVRHPFFKGLREDL
jgi:bifunctional non-homologous end joining protein LigD